MEIIVENRILRCNNKGWSLKVGAPRLLTQRKLPLQNGGSGYNMQKQSGGRGQWHCKVGRSPWILTEEEIFKLNLTVVGRCYSRTEI